MHMFMSKRFIYNLIYLWFIVAQEPCILYCMAETSSYVFTIKHTATDGMKCRGDKDICVEGTCQV